MRLKIAVVDDQPMFRFAAAHALADLLHEQGILELASPCELDAASLRTAKVDLVLLGINTAGTSGLLELAKVHRALPELCSIVVAVHGYPQIVDQSRRLGASGFVSKSSPVAILRSAVRTAMSGGTWFKSEHRTVEKEDAGLALQMAELTPKQMRVLELVAQGLSNRQIGAALGAAENTVKCHVVAILSKLECRSRTQAAVLMNTARVERHAL